jgi:hypothetical protein
MPYGRAWFLRLAVEWKQGGGDDRLRNMAGEVAASLVAYLSLRPIDPLRGSYESDSWALINLDRYARFTGDQRLMDFVAAKTRAAPLLQSCPFDVDKNAGSFMAVCTNWAWLIGEVVGGSAGRDRIETMMASADLAPLTAAATDHLSGLDFSRAWGLWQIWRQTGDPKFLDAYLAHVSVGYLNAGWWDGPYDTVAHWVPQFGVLAILPLFEPDYD